MPATDKPAQLPLIEAAYLAFRAPAESIDDPPSLDETRTYVIKATAFEMKVKRMKDGELRNVINLDIEEIYEEGKQPPESKRQPGLFAVESDEDGEAEDEVEDEAEGEE